MQTWANISWWAGGILAVAALVVAVFALFRDRSRGRRRCPRCWYDMAGVTGMRCPECGREQKAERRFFRTRRRWRLGAVAAVLLLAGVAAAVAPAIVTGNWARHTPVWMLRATVRVFESERLRAREQVTWFGVPPTMTSWERLMLAGDIAAGLRCDFSDRSKSSFDGRRTQLVNSHDMAIGLLEELGDEARPALRELAACMRDERLLREATDAHLKLGAAASPNIPALLTLLDPAHPPSVRQSALGVLIRIASDDRRLKRRLRALRDDTDWTFRMSAAAAECRVGSAALEHLLTTAAAAASEGDTQSRLLVLDAVTTAAVIADSMNSTRSADAVLADLRIRRPVHEYATGELLRAEMNWQVASASDRVACVKEILAVQIKCLHAEEWIVRDRAAHALLLSAHPLPTDVLRLLESEPEPGLRRTLLRTFAARVQENDPRLCAALIGELKEPSPQVQRWATKELRRFGEMAADGADALLAVARADPAFNGADVCITLAGMGERGWERIDGTLRDRNAPEREGFIGGLADMAHNEPRAAAWMLTLARDPDTGVRLAAVSALGDTPGAPDVLEALVRDDPEVDVRCRALIVLDSCAGGTQLARTVAGALGDRDKKVRETAASIFAQLTFSTADEQRVLNEVLRHDDPWVRAQAAPHLRE